MNPLWLATRATGEVSLVLFTLVTIMGVSTTKGWASARWPESVVTLMHRNVSLLSLVFLGVHIATTVVDGYVPIGWVDAVIPFQTSYRTLWIGLGTIAFDLVLAVIVTSLLRRRIPQSLWKGIHWSSYGLWAVAVVHSLGAGTDRLLTRILAALMVAAVAAAVAARFMTPHRQDDPVVSVPARMELGR
ncbi:MAG: ferric reductase [Frankiales bacterium]|nr:ferric reductase [Frankiales bacterium]